MQDSSESVECDLFETYRKMVVERESYSIVKVALAVDNRGSDSRLF